MSSPIRRSATGWALAVVFVMQLALEACGREDTRPMEGAGTPELRAALFDSILARTERRDAFSPVKNEALGYDPLDEMRALRDTVIGADTEERLFYALTRLSNRRRDRHLSVALVPGGLELSDSTGVPIWGDASTQIGRAHV